MLSSPPQSKSSMTRESFKTDTFIVPMLLALLRILICFWPQTGYLHPDEFFQSTDIVAGKQLGAKIEPVWEFTTDRPIRCMLLPSILNGIAFKIVKNLHLRPSAYILLVAPRLIYTLASFSIDYSLLILCRYYSSKGLPYVPMSVIFQSSFICLSILTRTLSNTTEAIILAWLLVVVCRVVRPSFRIVFVTPKLSKPINQRITKSAQVTSSVLIGFLVILGTMNRPTFICFALAPCLYWLMESYKRNSNSTRLTVQRALLPLMISSLLTFFIISCFDTIYYKDYATVKNIFNDLLNQRYEAFYKNVWTNWVTTPYNFLVYNTNVNNLANYGIHKPYTHLLVNLPLAFNLLAIVFYRKLAMQLITSTSHRSLLSSHRIQNMMVMLILTSTLLLSLIPHQEFRFLAPIVIPLVFICSADIYSNKKLLTLWFAMNFILIYFYARVHQSGITNALLDLDLTLKSYRDEYNSSKISVIASNCYPVPTYVLSIDNDDKRFHLDLGLTITDNFRNNIDEKLRLISKRTFADDVDSMTDHLLFVMLPRLYVDELAQHFRDHFDLNTSITDVKNYTYHFSGEDFLRSIGHIRKNGISAWTEAFGFSLMQVNIGTDREDIE